jgi:hypothetical protein
MSDILDAIRAGDRVTIVNRFGQQSTGRAVMRGPAGWVLNMEQSTEQEHADGLSWGSHAVRRAIASDENIIKVKASKR